MTSVTPIVPFRTSLGVLGIPTIESDKISLSRGKGGKNVGIGGGSSDRRDANIEGMILQSIITTLIFLIIIVFFTLALNAATRYPIASDFYLLQYSVYFSILA